MPGLGGGGSVRAKRFDPGEDIFEARIELSTERRDLPDMAGAARLLYGSRQVSERGEPQIGGHAGEGVRGRPHLDEIHVAPGRGETVAMGR